MEKENEIEAAKSDLSQFVSAIISKLEFSDESNIGMIVIFMLFCLKNDFLRPEALTKFQLEQELFQKDSKGNIICMREEVAKLMLFLD